MFTLSDHTLVFILILAWPIYAAFVQFPRLKRGVAAGVRGIRVRAYIQATITQWILAASALTIWVTAARPFADLGFSAIGGWRLAVGIIVLAAAIVLFVVQRRKILASEALQLEFKKKVANASALLPDNGVEISLFQLVSVTAGVCEEILYRGFLMWYLSVLAGPIVAIVGSSFFFGFAHLYQGGKGMVQTGIVGLVLALLYVTTGSLWLPMLIHMMIDMNSGNLWYRIRNVSEPVPEAPSDSGDLS
jgi:membrane protease YdiL (CAAX protease family)